MVEGDPPLLRGAEDDRLLAAPAMRVAVGDGRGVEQQAALLQVHDDGGVGVENALAGERDDLAGEPSPVVHGREDRQAVLAAGQEIVHAVPRRRVHRAGPGIARDVLAQHQPGDTVRGERVGRPGRRGSLEVPSLDLGHDAVRFQPLHGQDLRDEVGCDQQDLLTEIHELVGEVGVQGDRHVRRERPGRRGPDQDRHLPSGEVREALVERSRVQGKAHVDRRGSVILVFHLRLRQRRRAAWAPVDRSLVAVNVAVLDEASDLLDDRPLVLRRHGEVGRAPFPEDAQPAEFLALDAHVLLRVSPARGPDLPRRHGRLLRSQILIHLVLDGQPVAVPSRDIRRVQAHHGARFHHHVLEDLVERLPQMNLTVGIGRPVVHHETGTPRPRAAHRRVDVHVVPLFQKSRFPAGEIRFHREVGSRQVESVLQIERFHGSRDRRISLAASGLAGARKHGI